MECCLTGFKSGCFELRMRISAPIRGNAFGTMQNATLDYLGAQKADLEPISACPQKTRPNSILVEFHGFYISRLARKARSWIQDDRLEIKRYIRHHEERLQKRKTRRTPAKPSKKQQSAYFQYFYRNTTKPKLLPVLSKIEHLKDIFFTMLDC